MGDYPFTTSGNVLSDPSRFSKFGTYVTAQGPQPGQLCHSRFLKRDTSGDAYIIIPFQTSISLNETPDGSKERIKSGVGDELFLLFLSLPWFSFLDNLCESLDTSLHLHFLTELVDSPSYEVNISALRVKSNG